MASNFILYRNSSGSYIIKTPNIGGDIIYVMDINVEKNTSNNEYLFYTKITSSSVLNNENKNVYFDVRLIDSPIIQGNSLTIDKIIIFFKKNDDENVYTEEITKLADDSTIEFSYDINRLAISPCALQLSSFYRPFFFNAALLLLPEGFHDTFSSVEKNSRCTGNLFFSIANGCTLRGEKGNTYHLGDVKFVLSNNNDIGKKENEYNFVIKKPYRNFSEIIFDSYNKCGHIAGIRESGSNKINEMTSFSNEDKYEKLKQSGFVLTEEINNSILTTTNVYNGSNKIPGDVFYYFDNKNASINENGKRFTIDGTKELNVSLNVTDSSPYGIDFKTINVSHENVKFYDSITNTVNGTTNVFNTSGSTTPNVRYYMLLNNYTIGDIDELLVKLNNISANDKCETWNKDTMKDYIWDFSKGWDSIHDLGIIQLTPSYTFNNHLIKYVIGICDDITTLNNEEYEKEKNEPFSIIKKHTNKFSIIKLYRVL